jgi:DNA-binding PadR family transcriptional regulator
MTDLGHFSDTALLIMASLAGTSRHGYAIMEDIEAFAHVRLGPGTLYGALARLEQRGWIEPLPIQDRRRPYRLTAAGAAALREQLVHLQQVAHLGVGRLASL